MTHKARSGRRANAALREAAELKQRPLPLEKQRQRAAARAERLERMNAGVPVRFAQNRKAA